eukprot:TRINITY_DN10555_c0_g4_i2.p1 TRINITY_DN10555_c0_g4~~TRINITY_DN10555_c0_g4_i2.p1  ORF type:complete len:156 (-),score=18.35 TRINITY_DN10555_c0_g4_i2:115-582(-)
MCIRDRVNKGLTHLRLDNTMLTNKGVKAICQGLMANKTLVSLELKRNTIKDDGAKVIENLLRTNTTLAYLYIECEIDAMGLKAINQGIEANRGLKELHLELHKAKYEDVELLLEAIKIHRGLKKLKVMGCELGSNEKKMVAERIDRSPNIKISVA